jgi:hypothetical protein
MNAGTGTWTHEGLDDAIVCVVLRSEVLVAYHPAVYKRSQRGGDDHCVLVIISIGSGRGTRAMVLTPILVYFSSSRPMVNGS